MRSQKVLSPVSSVAHELEAEDVLHNLDFFSLVLPTLLPSLSCFGFPLIAQQILIKHLFTVSYVSSWGRAD